MAIQCMSCFQVIPERTDHRRPPWCPKCGADFKPGRVSGPDDTAAPAEAPSAPAPGREPEAVAAAVRETGFIPAVEEPKRPRQRVFARFGTTLGMVGGLMASFSLAPQLLPHVPGQGGGPGQLLLTAILCGIGSSVGWFFGTRLDADRR